MTAIFDLDGTLVDSSKVLSNAINYVRASLNLPPLPKKEIIEQINNPECNYAEYFYNLEEIKPVHEKLFKDYYSKNHAHELELFNGILEMLNNLKSKDIKLALATNAYKDSTIDLLEHLEMVDYFDTIVTFNDVKEPKPAPDMLYKAIEDLNSKKAIFIGDSQRDLLASKSANIEFVLVDFVNNKSNIIDIENKIISTLAK